VCASTAAGPYRGNETTATTHVVALTRVREPLDARQEAPRLASELGLSPYDVRMMLRGQTPIVVLRTSEWARAGQALAVLREWGHGAVACDLGEVASGATAMCPRAFTFEDGAFVAIHPSWARRTVRFDEIAVLVRATWSTSAADPVVLDPTLAFVLTPVPQGLSPSPVPRRVRSADVREQVLYVFLAPGLQLLLLRETALDYRGLGERAAHAIRQNFSTVVAELRARAPLAVYDARLVSRRRKSTIAKERGKGRLSPSAPSNVAETDLAAHLIALAHRDAQL
jgi:hypothetical protein